MLRAARAGAVAALAAAVTLSACGEPASDDDADSSQPVGANVRFRLWDEAAATAYQESFDAFNAIHRDIHVEVEVVPAASYASRAVSDLTSGTMADVFWVASDAAVEWADLADLVEPVPSEEWEPGVADLFTRDGELWAVPQLWETSTLFVNTDLLEGTDVEPATLVWDPAALPPEPEPSDTPTDRDNADAAETTATTANTQDDDGDADDAPDGEPASVEDIDDAEVDDRIADGPADQSPPADDAESPEVPDEDPAPPTHDDTLRDAVRALTRDAEGRSATDPEFDAGTVTEYGFNLDLTAPSVWLTFLAQDVPAGESLVLADDESAAALSYLRELPAVTTAPNGPAPPTDRELFTEGRLALFQSTSADLRQVSENTDDAWAVAPVPAGPTGAVSVVSAIGAAGNIHSPHPEATAEVLEWISSTDGQSALASHSVGIPAALGAQELFVRAWADRGLETALILDPAVVVTIPTGARSVEALRAVGPVLAQFFDGEISVAEALPAARRAAQEAADGAG